jgi:remodeling and spacing factor 1
MYLCFCSSSLEEEEEQEQTEEEEDESNIVFKSDHEFSPESDLENEDAEVQPTRRARTAQKGKHTYWRYETFSFITALLIILQICHLHSS